MSITPLAASGGASFLPILLVLFLAMWLFVMRPQKKRQQAQQALLRNVGVGDEIVTAGGLIGRVTALAEEELTLEIAPGTHVRVARKAVAAVMRDEAAEDVVDDAAVEHDEALESAGPAEVEAAEGRRG